MRTVVEGGQITTVRPFKEDRQQLLYGLIVVVPHDTTRYEKPSHRLEFFRPVCGNCRVEAAKVLIALHV